MKHEPECGHSHPELYGHLGKCRCDILRAAYERGMEAAAVMAENRWRGMKSCDKPDDCVVIAIGAWLVSEDIRFVLEGGDYAKVVREMRHEDNRLDS